MSVDLGDSEIYSKYAEDLTRFATGLVGPSNAADVVSEAVLSCLNSKQWQNVAEKRSYLYRSVYNKAAEFHRSSSRRRHREELVAQSEIVEAPELRPEVLSAVFKLSVRQRAVIVLTYWEDLDPTAIASVLDITDGSVRRHLARGKSHLKETLYAHDR
jgi:RNA polymerase sigma factor (sigma-70 family)